MKIYPWMYALVFIILLLAWPFYIVNHSVMLLLCVMINSSMFLTVVWFTSSRELNFWRGLRLLCASYSTGCANITILYIFPLLLFYYIQMIGATWRGIQRGKSYTENWWIKTISQRCQAKNQKISNHNTHYNKTDDKGDDLRLDLTLGFYEAIFGCEKEIRISHLEAEPDGNIVQVTKKLKITIPAGVDTGTRLRISGEGDVSRNSGKHGDLYVYLTVFSEDNEFRRDGINILSDLTITAEKAKLGGEVIIKTIDGETKLIIPPETKSGDYLTLTGYGVPGLASSNYRGDHIIQILFSE